MSFASTWTYPSVAKAIGVPIAEQEVFAHRGIEMAKLGVDVPRCSIDATYGAAVSN
jgi:hypothetical protein